MSAGARFSLPRLSELGDLLTIFYLIGSRRKPVSISAKKWLNPKKIFFGLQNFQYSNKQYSPILCYDLLVVTSRRTNMRNFWHCVTASTIWLYQKIPKSSELSTDTKKNFFSRDFHLKMRFNTFWIDFEKKIFFWKFSIFFSIFDRFWPKNRFLKKKIQKKFFFQKIFRAL